MLFLYVFCVSSIAFKNSFSCCYFKIIEIEGREVLFRTAVQAGTYIRKLCHDIGKKLGVGANMRELRRTRAGPFTQTHTLQEINEAWQYYKETGEEMENFFRK